MISEDCYRPRRHCYGVENEMNLFITFRGGEKKEQPKKINVEFKQDEMLNPVLSLGKDAK